MTRLEFNNQVFLLSRKLYLVAFRFLRRQEDAEDAVQEVFIKLWNRLEELEKYSSLEAFAVTTTRNYCIDVLRKGKQMINEDGSRQYNIMNDEPTPHEELERSETSDLLHRIIKDLPENYRTIITLKEIDGMTYDEVAALTDQNVNTLRVNLSRARKMIREEFKKQRYEHSGNIQPTGKIL